MSTNVEISDRLKAERQRLGLTQGAMAAATKVSKTSQVNYESGLRTPDAVYLAAADKVGVDVQFVVSGKRSTTVDLADDFVVIQTLGITASAGNGVLNGPEAEYNLGGLCFSRSWLTRRKLSAASLKVIEVKGASMQGVLEDGDSVLIDMQDIVPRSGYIYVLRQGSELLAKHCQLLPGGVLRVSSANPQYAPYDVELDKTADVTIIGRVVASMHEW
jgi:transcriptional regulator with XRE-family HTH domain